MLRADGERVESLAVHPIGPHAATFVTRRHPAPGLADSTVLVVRTRHVGNGMVEDVTVENLSREHAVVETGGVRTAKTMGLRNLPSKTWQVNKGWVIAANIAADLAAWTRLLGFGDDLDLREADPETLRYRVWHIPARLARHARERILKISPDWPWKEAFLTCWQRLCALPSPA